MQKQSDEFYLIVESAGPDKKFNSKESYGDDFELWRSRITYFAEVRYQIEKSLNSYEKMSGKFPGDEATFRVALNNANINFDNLRDPLGHGFYAVIGVNVFFTDRPESITYSKFGENPLTRTELTPITQKRISINIRGLGEDDKDGTRDDYSVVQFARVVEEQSSRDAAPAQKTQIAKGEKKEEKKVSSAIMLPGLGGTITGKVTDPTGAAVANTVVTASNNLRTTQYSATTNAEGLFFMRGLPPDTYDIHFDARGFKKHVVGDVSVVAGKTVVVDGVLSVGSVSETVTITSETVQLQTSHSAVSSVVVQNVQSLPINSRNFLQLAKINPGASQADISTPRLREYYPETLLWQPNIETDKQGRAQLKFKLADNITTWKLSLIGSTVDGQIGTVEKDIRAFQPFFAELDPPKILTEGDEISLPVVLRNYLDKPQSVDVQFKPESWFTMLSPARKKSEVKANDSTNEIFNFRAIASINKGKQRVTAIASAASDAIEKTVNVHPDGEEIAETSAGVFNETGALEINLPKESIAGSVRGELKIYPNLLAHVTEGIEGILQRPHGCGEQTISSTYPNVMALRLLKSSSVEKHAIEKTARKYTQAGYERLLGYRHRRRLHVLGQG